MTCEECKAMRATELAQKPPETIPYYTHEKDMARMERANKRLIALLVLCLSIIAGSWAGFFWYESQFEDVEITQENADGYNNFIGNDGDIWNGETDNQETHP